MGTTSGRLGNETPYEGEIHSQSFNVEDYPEDNDESHFSELESEFDRSILLSEEYFPINKLVGEIPEDLFDAYLEKYKNKNLSLEDVKGMTLQKVKLGHDYVINEKMYGDVVYKKVDQLTEKDINHIVDRTFELFEKYPSLRKYGGFGGGKDIPGLNIYGGYDKHKGVSTVPHLIESLTNPDPKSNNYANPFISKSAMKDYIKREMSYGKRKGKNYSAYESPKNNSASSFLTRTQDGVNITEKSKVRMENSILDVHLPERTFTPSLKEIHERGGTPDKRGYVGYYGPDGKFYPLTG